MGTSHKKDTIAGAYDLLPVYAFSLDCDGHINYLNKTLLNDLGFSASEVVGKKLDDMVSGGTRLFLQTHLYPLLKLKGSADEIYIVFKTNGLAEIPVLLNAVFSNSSDENPEFRFGGIRITRRNEYEKGLVQDKKNAQQALEENGALNELKEKLVRSQEELEAQLRTVSANAADQAELSKVLAHDLQEPLRKISIFSSRLLNYDVSGMDQRTYEMLGKIMSFTAKVRKLLDSLEKFNSLGSRKANVEKVGFHDLAQTLKSHVESAHAGEKIDFDTSEFGNGRTEITSDSYLIAEMLKELVDNAIIYKDPEKEFVCIKISTSSAKKNAFTELQGEYRYRSYLVITFASNGIGNFDSKSNAFELFRRFDHIVNESLIGLTYCRRITQLLQGEISVTSQFGQGNVFTISLPTE